MERKEMLCLLADKVKGCKRCLELVENRSQTVFGRGNYNAKIVLLGEAPGKDEDEQGFPFVGRAGQLLDKILEACGLTDNDVYICNILKCRPPGNRNPTLPEANNCRQLLDLQLDIIQPQYIVCLGTIAAHRLLDETTPISGLRGDWHTYQKRKVRAQVLCTYHPAYLLRNQAAKKSVWDDLQLLLKALKGG